MLELIAAEHLYHTYLTSDEGELTRLRASVVNTKSLARLASRLSLGDYLLLGKGAHKTGARSLQSILANTFEAVIGAIFLDQGYRAAYKLFSRSLIDVQAWPDDNYKGRLQEVTQERFLGRQLQGPPSGGDAGALPVDTAVRHHRRLRPGASP